jgi:hypothetical protein
VNQPASDRTAYVRAVIACYRRVIGAGGRTRREDHRLAADLHQRGVSLAVVETALLLATARRGARPSEAPPLSAVRSLHYFLPVVEELLQTPPPDDYLDYLRETVGEMIDHEVDAQHPPTGAVQKTTLSDDR